MDKKDKKFFFLMLSLLLTTVPLAFSTLLSDVFELPKRFFLMTFTSWTLLYRVLVLKGVPWKLPPKKLTLTAVAYFMLVLISWFFSLNRASSKDYVIDLFCFIALFIITASVFNREDVKHIIPFLLITGTAVSVYSLIQHVGLDPVGWVQQRLVRSRSISTIGNPDFLSAFLIMLIPVALMNGFRKNSPFGGIASLFVCTLMIISNVLTYSRTGLIAMILGIIITIVLSGSWFFTSDKKKTAGIIILLIIAFSLVVAFEHYGNKPLRLARRLTSIISPGEINIATRMYLWKTAASLIKEHPVLGIGPDNFDVYYLKYRYLEPPLIRGRIASAESSHNYYLDIAVYSGIPALVAFLLFSGFLLREVFKLLKTCRNEINDEAIIFFGLAGGIITFFISHVSIYPVLPTSLLFWLFASFLIIPSSSLGGFEKNEKKSSPKDKKSQSFLSFVLFIILGIGLAVLFLIPVTADYYYNRALYYKSKFMGLSSIAPVFSKAMPEEEITQCLQRIRYQQRQFFEKSVHYFSLALRLSPLSQEYWLGFGKMLEAYSYINADADDNLRVVNGAIYAYNQAISLRPGNPYPYADKGRILSRWGEKEQAEQQYRLALKLDPYNPVFLTDLASLLEWTAQYRQAESLLLKACEINFMSSHSYGSLGIFYFWHGNYQKAEKFFTEAHVLEPKNTEYTKYLRWIQGIKNNQPALLYDLPPFTIEDAGYQPASEEPLP